MQFTVVVNKGTDPGSVSTMFNYSLDLSATGVSRLGSSRPLKHAGPWNFPRAETVTFPAVSIMSGALGGSTIPVT